MNKSHRSIWNESLGTWIATWKNAITRSKKIRSGATAGMTVAGER